MTDERVRRAEPASARRSYTTTDEQIRPFLSTIASPTRSNQSVMARSKTCRYSASLEGK